MTSYSLKSKTHSLLRIGSNHGITRLLRSSIQEKRRRASEVQTQPHANGLLREASVALQGLLMPLANSSHMRDRDPLVLQHKRPPSALGQATLMAIRRYRISHRGKPTPTPFQLGWRPSLLGL